MTEYVVSLDGVALATFKTNAVNTKSLIAKARKSVNIPKKVRWSGGLRYMFGQTDLGNYSIEKSRYSSLVGE